MFSSVVEPFDEGKTATATAPRHVKRETIYEQKFYLSLLHMPSLLYDMTDTKKSQLASSSNSNTDSPLDLVLPQILALFVHPRTCVQSLLHLFAKLAKFIPRGELVKRFLPIVIHVLNVVDLNETLGIDLNEPDLDDEVKARFCKLFDYVFINELRIIFGLKVFLTQICPFLIEAISGFKDFDYDSAAADSISLQASRKSTHQLEHSGMSSLSTLKRVDIQRNKTCLI